MEAVARLQNSPYPPRKMALLADMIRGMQADRAMYLLQLHDQKMYAKALGKLLRSAIANWQQANSEAGETDPSELVVKRVQVNKGRMLKRIQPAPQGRAHRIMKRYSHITLIVDTDGGEMEMPQFVNDAQNQGDKK